MTVFQNPGKENTEAALRIAIHKAAELDTDLVLASVFGGSALTALKLAREEGFQGRIIVVRSVSSIKQGGVNRLTDEVRSKLESEGAVIVTAAHALSAGERGISQRFQGVYPLELMAGTLRMLGAGLKVAAEVSIMALDADAIRWGKPVVALGGTGSGLDTAAVITPAYSANILDTLIHEILCKPGYYK